MVYSQWKARVPGGQDMANWSCLLLRFDLAARDLGCQPFIGYPGEKKYVAFVNKKKK